MSHSMTRSASQRLWEFTSFRQKAVLSSGCRWERILRRKTMDYGTKAARKMMTISSHGCWRACPTTRQPYVMQCVPDWAESVIAFGIHRGAASRDLPETSVSREYAPLKRTFSRVTGGRVSDPIDQDRRDRVGLGDGPAIEERGCKDMCGPPDGGNSLGRGFG